MSNAPFWTTVDTAELLRKREEATVAANAGAFAVPLGEPMRRTMPATIGGSHRDVLRKLGDSEHQRALRSMGWLD